MPNKMEVTLYRLVNGKTKRYEMVRELGQEPLWQDWVDAIEDVKSQLTLTAAPTFDEVGEAGEETP